MINLIAFQQSIASTGVAQNLPSNPVINSVVITAKASNTADTTIGNVSTVTSSTGYVLAKGTSVVLNLTDGNTNAVWIAGTSGDVVSVVGA